MMKKLSGPQWLGDCKLVNNYFLNKIKGCNYSFSPAVYSKVFVGSVDFMWSGS